VQRTGNSQSLRSKLLFLSGITLFCVQVVQAKVDVTATVDRNQMAVGEAFVLQVSVSSEDSVQVHPPSLPDIPNTQIINQWASTQSKSSVISTGQGIDFKTIRSKVFNYQILVDREGEVVIPPIAVDVAGTQYRTAPIQLRAYGAGAGRLANGTPPQEDQSAWPRDPVDELEERFNQLLNRQFGGPTTGGFMTGPRNDKDAFFVLAEIDKTEAYKGEQITASWYLYTRGRVQDIDSLKYPNLKGFWKEDIQISTHLNFERDVINGIPYNRALLVSYALFPIEEGKALIDSYRVKATIAGGFGFGRGFQATKSSEEIPVMIKPLPKDGVPSDFTGAVGEFQMMVDAPSKTIVAHQPFSLKVRFEGRGNAKTIELPKLNLGEGLEVYDVSNESNFFKNGQSYKEFDVLLIAREPGETTLDSFKASYFNPKTRSYATLSSQPITLNVLPGVKQDSLGEERIQPEEVQEAKLPEIRTQWAAEKSHRSYQFLIWLVLFTIVLLFLLAKLVFDLGFFSQPPTLQEVLDHRFKELDKLVSKKQLRQLGIQATNTIYYTLGDISGEGGANEEFDKVLAKVAPSVRREIEVPLRKLVDYFGVLGFGPKAYMESLGDTKNLKKNVEELKIQLHKAAKINQGSYSADV